MIAMRTSATFLACCLAASAWLDKEDQERATATFAFQDVDDGSATDSEGNISVTGHPAISSYIASQYRIPEHQASHIVGHAFSISRSLAIDPLLILSVAAVESWFRDAGNPGGGDNPSRPHGIMQVHGKWHADKFPSGEPEVLETHENLRIGAMILTEYLALEKGDVRRALKRYHGSINLKDDPYPDKVLAVLDQLRSILPATRRPGVRT